jgi:hypothetical protein
MSSPSSAAPCAAATIVAGFCRRSRARSGVVTTSATPPSLSWQQSSSRRTGSTIHRDCWWSASVIGRW